MKPAEAEVQNLHYATDRYYVRQYFGGLVLHRVRLPVIKCDARARSSIFSATCMSVKHRRREVVHGQKHELKV